MDSPEQWRWIWLAATAVFAIGEMATPGSFFLAPFAAGALVASLLAFAGVSVLVEWIVFIAVSVVMLALLRPLSKRLDREALDHGVGSRRLIGHQATVLRTIPAGDEIGMVRVDREQWRAQSIDGTPIPEGIAVRIADVQGTRVIVAPVDATSAPAALSPQPQDNPAATTSAPAEPTGANPPTPPTPGERSDRTDPTAAAAPSEPEAPSPPATPPGSVPAGRSSPASRPAGSGQSAEPTGGGGDAASGPSGAGEPAEPSAEPVEPPASRDGPSSP
jgi:membrane protein implicated in regulation of membrane protease activity